MIPNPNYISTAELAELTGLSHAAILKRINKGQIRAVKIGRSYAIPKSYFKEYFPSVEVQVPVEGEYLSVMEAAQILGLTRMAIFKRVKAGTLPAKRVGRHYVIHKDSVAQTEKAALEPTIKVDKDYLSAPELAKALGVSRISVFKQIQQGKIKAEKVGRHYVIAREDVPASEAEKLIKKGEGQGTRDGIAEKKEEYISVMEAARLLGMSRIAVFKKIKKGQIEAIRIGRSYAIKREELGPFLQSEK